MRQMEVSRQCLAHRLTRGQIAHRGVAGSQPCRALDQALDSTALQSPWFAGPELLRRNKSNESDLANDPDLVIEATEVNPCISGELTRSLARFGSIQL
jgi:hypothetical protein